MIHKNEIKEITYNGGCDVIRTKNFLWKEFQRDNVELIFGKRYKVIGTILMQLVYKKNDDNQIAKDWSGNRYLYWKIKNEFDQEIYVWEGFFEENTYL